MVKKASTAFPRIDYSVIDICTEEAKNIEAHRPSMICALSVAAGSNPARQPKVLCQIRIIPSKLWIDDIQRFVGLLSHESLHIYLLFHFGTKEYMQLDNLPDTENFEMFQCGVFGWNLNKFEWKWRGNNLPLEEVEKLKLA
jgi:hypothetical protein